MKSHAYSLRQDGGFNSRRHREPERIIEQSGNARGARLAPDQALLDAAWPL